MKHKFADNGVILLRINALFGTVIRGKTVIPAVSERSGAEPGLALTGDILGLVSPPLLSRGSSWGRGKLKLISNVLKILPINGVSGMPAGFLPDHNFYDSR